MFFHQSLDGISKIVCLFVISLQMDFRIYQKKAKAKMSILYKSLFHK